MASVLTDLPPNGNWTFSKFWNAEVIPNSIVSFNGQIASVIDGKMIMKKVYPKSACYSVKIDGRTFDACQLIWRAFTTTKVSYSSEHYNVRIIDEGRSDKLSYDNLKVTVVSSIFEQWSKEEETWP